MLKAVLTYRLDGRDVPLGQSSDPILLRALRDRIVEAAASDLRSWHDTDPDVAALASAEVETLTRLLGVLLPDPKPTGTATADGLPDQGAR